MSFTKLRRFFFALTCLSLLVSISACGSTTDASMAQFHPTQALASPTIIPTQALASPTIIPTQPAGTLLLTYGGHTRGINSVAWSSDGTRIVTGSGDGTAQVWNATTGERLLIHRGSQVYPDSVSWSPSGTRIVSSHDYGEQVLIWDAQTGQTLQTYQDNQGQQYLRGATWSPNGKYIAFYQAGNEWSYNEIYVMDANTGKLILSLPVENGRPVMDLEWSPDSTRLAYIAYDATVPMVRIIAAATGQLLLTYSKAGGRLTGLDRLAWSPNGKYIASSCLDTAIQVWDATTGKTVYTYTGHTDDIGAIAWSPDSTRIASSSAEQIQVWDAFTGQHVFIYSGHHLRVQDLTWSPDGTRIVSVSMGNGQGEVQVWQSA